MDDIMPGLIIIPSAGLAGPFPIQKPTRARQRAIAANLYENQKVSCGEDEVCK
jgi:hypothetical protein